jgi:hypothetical protein
MGRYLKLAMAFIERRVPLESAAIPVTGGGRVSPGPEAGRDLEPDIPGAAPCGSPACAGCYDVGGGKKIHPPECGPGYAE